MQQNKSKRFFLKNLKWYEHLAAGWPIIFIFFGGAIGGVCGGFAYLLNGKIFNSNLSKHLKYIFAFLIGIGSLLLYVILVAMLFILFPGLAKR
ncbi:MAG: hypothetical protein AMJ95_09190 [Omnitrophica WOR_2 bacterium SM23_72]|nr:MAG: hypothetical protein AMJ95_09190 [Omnitrophica WOR_2 bacterium SM23_72]